MPCVGFETWWPKQCPTNFVVKNIAQGNKRIHIFNYPIGNGKERDLMAIPYVSEADIRHSLLKGDLYIKLVCSEITVTSSNIDLTQYDSCQLAFLQQAGITTGLVPSGGGSTEPVLLRENVQLVGPTNSANIYFLIPYGESFINENMNGNDYRIIISHNGRRLIEDTDYTILESAPGSGYNMIRIDSFIPNKNSNLIADYYVLNTQI
jgi:hypothetical protein